MPILLAGALRAAALMTAVLLGSAAVLAHGGEDHSHDKPAAAVTAAQPRVSIHSEQYELVGVLRGPWLDVYLDHFGTNEPVTGAKIAITIGHGETTAARSGDDLLIGTLARPDRTATRVASASTPLTASW